MIVSPTPPEFGYELADSGDLFIQFTNSNGGSSSWFTSDPALMRWVGERCLETSQTTRDVTAQPADRNAATVDVTLPRTVRRRGSADPEAADPAATLGPAPKGGLCIRFTRPDGTAADLLLSDPQLMRDVALVFLRGAEVCTELRSDGLGVLYSSEYDTDDHQNENEDEDL